MAYSISISTYPGYPTQTAIRVSVYFTVTAAGSYYTTYEVYDLETGDLAASGSGNSYSMSANGNSTQITSDFYKTITGLESGRDYYIIAYLHGPSGTWASNTLYFTTTSPTQINVYYYDGDLSSTATSSSSVTVRGPFRSDWDFVGWATEPSSISIAYLAGSTISVTSGTKNVFLYAVYQNVIDTVYCYYIDGLTGELASNSRDRIQYRCNTDTKTSSTSYYNNFSLPLFSADNRIITTSDPDRDWDAIGWRLDTRAVNATYSPGHSFSGNLDTGDFYAVYSNTCSVTYNSNGGSGSMSSTYATAYYNASGTYSTPTISVSDCSFTAPAGKKFSHWNTRADGTGTSYSGSSTTSGNYNVIFYAIWITGRPENWSWVSTVSKGSEIPHSGSGSNIVVKPLTASEWLAFVERIESFYAYLNKTVDSTYLYRATNGVSSGASMTTTQANGARYLIAQLSPPTSVPSSVSSGDRITAAFINGLKNSLNSIK